jgi:hypothetical protein
MSVVPGYRTQQSPIDDPKVRLVWAIPCHIWQMECEAFDDSITESIKMGDSNHDIQHFYFDPRKRLKEWYLNYHPKVTCWVNLDASAYDSTVHSNELAAVWTWLAPDYPWIELLSEYAAHADIIMPDGVVSRTGGMPSGSKGTNIGDSITNVGDNLEVLNEMRLSKYVECILVNGDDITIGFSTKIIPSNLEKWANRSRRNLNPEKSETFPTTLWNSKWVVTEYENTYLNPAYI